MIDTIFGPPRYFNIAFYRWDLLMLTFDRLTSKAYRYCVKLLT